MCFRLYDKDDFDSDDYLGTCSFPLKNAVVTEDDPDAPDAKPLPDPHWVPFFYEVPGDSQGELLVNVELIKTMKAPEDLKKIRSIVPEQRPAFIEFIVIGMRYSRHPPHRLISHRPLSCTAETSRRITSKRSKRRSSTSS